MVKLFEEGAKKLAAQYKVNLEETQKVVDGFKKQQKVLLASLETDGDIKNVSSLDQLDVIKELGKVAFGTVSLVKYKDQQYAVKEIEKSQIIKQLNGDEERYFVMRDREILVSQMVFDIDYCIKFYVHFEQNGKEYFVYEFCSGGDLTAMKSEQPEQRFTEVSGKKFIEQMAYSIYEMHKKRIVHRDIKPDNVFITDKTSEA